MFKKILSTLMVVVLVFSLSAPAYAVTPGDDMIGQIDLTPEEIAKANAEAKTIFENLTPSQQAVFLANIEALAYNGDESFVSLLKQVGQWELQADKADGQIVIHKICDAE